MALLRNSPEQAEKGPPIVVIEEDCSAAVTALPDVVNPASQLGARCTGHALSKTHTRVARPLRPLS